MTVLVVGCADPADRAPVPEVEVPRSGGTLHIAQIAPSTLDPAVVYDSYDAALVNQIHAGLLRHDRNFGLRPDLARSWWIDTSGLRYRFELNDDLRFHDGTPVTAHDVSHSWHRVFRIEKARTELARQYLGVIAGTEAFARGEIDSIVGIRVIDARTIEIDLERPYAAFLNVLASEFARVVPRSTTLDTDTPIGCGPFALVEWVAGDRLVLERHDTYHGTPVHIERLVVHTPPDPVLPRAIEAFVDGRLHLVELTTSAADPVEAVDGVELHQRRELSLTFLAFSVDRPPFDDVRVRRAVAHATDAPSLIGVDATRRPPATGVLPPGFPGYEPAVKRLGFAPDRADSLLAAAGFPGGRGLEPIVVGIPRRGEQFEKFALDLCRQLENAGLPVQPRVLDWQRFDRGLRNHEFDAFLLTWIADLPDADSFFYPLFHSTGSVNHLHYVDHEVDAWLDQARGDVDRDHRTSLYRRAERRVLDDAAIVPLHFNSTMFAVRTSVRGFEIASMGGSQLPLRSVWLEAEDPVTARVEVAR